MSKVAILAVVGIALGTIFWMKSRPSEQAASAGAVVPPTSAEAAEEVAGVSVLLFADPREAETSCGCAEVIRLTRDAGVAPGVHFREFDTREATTEAKRYGVRVSPTVILTDSNGVETERFEGESGDVITKLHGALNALQADTQDDEITGR